MYIQFKVASDRIPPGSFFRIKAGNGPGGEDKQTRHTSSCNHINQGYKTDMKYLHYIVRSINYSQLNDSLK